MLLIKYLHLLLCRSWKMCKRVLYLLKKKKKKFYFIITGEWLMLFTQGTITLRSTEVIWYRTSLVWSRSRVDRCVCRPSFCYKCHRNKCSAVWLFIVILQSEPLASLRPNLSWGLQKVVSKKCPKLCRCPSTSCRLSQSWFSAGFEHDGSNSNLLVLSVSLLLGSDLCPLAQKCCYYSCTQAVWHVLQLTVGCHCFLVYFMFKHSTKWRS